jgi:hypothetical protein
MAKNEPKRTAVIETQSVLVTADGKIDLERGTEKALVIRCVPLGQSILIRPSMLEPGIVEDAALHGLKQKHIDAAAIARNPANGQSATPADKWAAIVEVYERLTGENPSWNATERGGGGEALVLQAIIRVKSSTDEAKVRAWWDTRTEAEKKKLAQNPQVVRVMGEIRAERLAAKSPATEEELWAGLEEDTPEDDTPQP